ncbi:MAG: Ig-like domain-containing protein [Bacteroidales bacterium]|nr:Ig-like domain-containing protein [Bacteroidales bacterium]
MKKTITQTMSALMSLAMISGLFFGCGPKEEPLPPTPPAPTTVSVTGVSLNKTSLSLVEGGSESLTATVSPDNATNKAVSWKSSDTGVATVDGSGKVTAVKAGSATITVTTTDGSKTATCSVTVTSKTVSVTGVKLDNDKLELKAGETAQLTATVDPSNASDKSLEWTSSDAKIATVDASGKVTAVGIGSATITVKTKDGGKTATCAVTVDRVAVEGVTVDPVKAEVVEGNTVQLKATVSPADAAQEVEWTSSDSDIATVDKNGLVTSIKPGTVYIVVRSKAYTDKQASCEVIVKQDDKLKGIAFDASEIQLETGQSRTLKVVFTPDYAANKNVSWSSSDPSVASVKDGNVTGVKEGKATITATSEDGGHKAECVVTVSKASGPQVFATTKNWRLLINGAQDPRDGTFTVGNSYKFAGMYQIYPEGHDLYSLEDFFTGSGHQLWVCKNRKPFIDVTKYLESASICDIAVRNGNVAILTTKGGNTSISVVMVKEGQKYVDSFDIPGEGSEFYSPTFAIAPNGDINIAAREKDAFWTDHLVWFKYNPVSGQFSFQRLDTAESGQIGATKSGDIYILSYKGIDGYTGCLFKNGKFDQNIDSSEDSFYSQLFCAGNDVYTAVMDFPGKKVLIRKNGKSYQTVKLDMVSIFPGDNAFWVTSNGDTYVCVEGHTATNDSRIYKNGKLLYKSDGFKNICVIEE